MEKRKKRLFVIGIVWAMVFFLWWVNSFFYINWQFHIFSFDSWRFVYNEFANGWKISSTSDWIFILSLIFAIPIYLFGWHICVQIKWEKVFIWAYKKIMYLLRGEKKTVIKKRIKLAAKKSYKKMRPMPLSSVMTTKIPVVQPVMKKEVLAEPESFIVPPPVAGDKFPLEFPDNNEKLSNFLLEDDKDEFSTDLTGKNSKSTVETATKEMEKISSYLSENGYFVMPDEMLLGQEYSFIAISGENILLCKKDEAEGDWLADEEEFNGEDPLWFSENSHRVSPVFQMKKVTNSLQAKIKEKELPHQVIPFLVKTKGTIINAEEMLPEWKKENAIVARAEQGGDEFLPDVEKAIPMAETEIMALHLMTIKDILKENRGV